MRAGAAAALLAFTGCSAGSDASPDALTCSPGTRPLWAAIKRYGSLLGDYTGSVCVEGRDDLTCATANGRIAMCVPDGELALRMTQSGFETAVMLLGPEPLLPGHTLFVADDGGGMRVWSSAGAYPPGNGGNVLIYVSQQMDDRHVPLANATVAIEPAAGLEVSYLGDHGFPAPGLLGTSLVGQAIVPNVPAGMYDLDVTSATAPSCASSYGGRVSSTGDARVPVTAGVTNVMFVTCSP